MGAGSLMTTLPVESARGFMANDALEEACIGTGGCCRALMKALVRVSGARIAAVCDIYDVHLDEARKIADPGAATSKQYEEVLDRKDVDAVLIASPDHWRVPMTVDACNAGKYAYVEKPLAHNFDEGAVLRTPITSPSRSARSSGA